MSNDRQAQTAMTNHGSVIPPTQKLIRTSRPNEINFMEPYAVNRSVEQNDWWLDFTLPSAGRVLGLLLANSHKPCAFYASKQLLLLSISTPLRKLEDQKQDYKHCQKRRDGRHIVVPP